MLPSSQPASFSLDLEAVRAEVLACTRCKLSLTRTRAVPGEGPPNAKVLFVGEGPGGRENETGRPFVGPAGQLLQELLESIGWKRSQVFITNIVKCWPPGNRDPLPEEKAACNGYLDRQIFALQPRLIVTLGRHSMEKFFGPGQSISRRHGTTTRWRGILCCAMYHPAAALHQPSLKAVLAADFARLPALLQQAEQEFLQEPAASEPTEPAAPPGEDDRQLRLF
jgi:uracil-DNA glycosylase family 4